jgi:replicative DNA helicase
VGIYDRATKKRMDDAMEALRPHPVTIWNPGAVTFANIRSAVRKLRARGGLDVLVIDHIDHVGGGVERRTAELEQLIRQVKSLAETEGIAVLAISHLSRNTAGGKVSRLKNSSSKEQDADVVMFLQPVKAEDGAWVEMSMEEAQLEKAANNWINIRLEIHKNREGMTGAVDLVLSWAEGGQYYEPGKSND